MGNTALSVVCRVTCSSGVTGVMRFFAITAMTTNLKQLGVC